MEYIEIENDLIDTLQRNDKIGRRKEDDENRFIENIKKLHEYRNTEISKEFLVFLYENAGISHRKARDFINEFITELAEKGKISLQEHTRVKTWRRGYQVEKTKEILTFVIPK